MKLPTKILEEKFWGKNLEILLKCNLNEEQKKKDTCTRVHLWQLWQMQPFPCRTLVVAWTCVLFYIAFFYFFFRSGTSCKHSSLHMGKYCVSNPDLAFLPRNLGLKKHKKNEKWSAKCYKVMYSLPFQWFVLNQRTWWDIHHHHHLSFNCEVSLGHHSSFAPSFLHFCLFSTALWNLANSRPVHSLMLSSHLSLSLPCLLPPFTVPCKMVLARPDEQ